MPGKGVDQEWVVNQVLRDLESRGHHGDLIMRCDSEPALVDLAREVTKEQGTRNSVLEHPPPAILRATDSLNGVSSL